MSNRSFTRRYRRRSKPAKSDGAFFKKETHSEQSFFGDAAHDAFFQPAVSNAPSQSVQRKCAGCEKEEKQVQRMEDKKEEDKKLQRAVDKKEEDDKKLMRAPEKKEEDDKKLQRATDKKEEDDKKLMRAEDKKEEDKKIQKKEAAAGSGSGASVSGYVNTLGGKGNAMPPAVNNFFASRMGYDFSNVKLHTDKEAADSAKSVNAKAYTIGNNIVFNEGQYNTASGEGKKLLAHELTHVIQQDENTVQKKDDDSEECSAGSVDLEAETKATYKKGAGKAEKEKTTKGSGCESCDDNCVNITGTLKVPYSVTTKINLPTVPGNLTPCQQDRVRTAINGPLLTHEKQHVKAFETFNGTASLPINFKGCEGDYTTYQENLAEQEFQNRKDTADAKSAALDPFSVNVDLCCKDKAKK